MIIDIRHTGIVVKDLKKSLAFYESLGFTVYEWRTEPKEFIDEISGEIIERLDTVKMMCPAGSMIELLDYGDAIEILRRSLFDSGLAHIAFTVNDIMMVYRKLIKTGIVFISPPVTSPNGYATVAFCQAPEGTFIELVEVLE